MTSRYLRSEATAVADRAPAPDVTRPGDGDDCPVGSNAAAHDTIFDENVRLEKSRARAACWTIPVRPVVGRKTTTSILGPREAVASSTAAPQGFPRLWRRLLDVECSAVTMDEVSVTTARSRTRRWRRCIHQLTWFEAS